MMDYEIFREVVKESFLSYMPESYQDMEVTSTGMYVSQSQRSSGKRSTMRYWKLTSRQRSRRCRRDRNVPRSRCRPRTEAL